MKKKVFYSIFCCLLLMIISLTLFSSSKKVNAQAIPDEYLTYEVISNYHFDDLPYAVNVPFWYLNRETFGYYLYNGERIFWLVIYSDTEITPMIFYSNLFDTVGLSDEIEDGEYYYYNAPKLTQCCDTVNQILYDNGFSLSLNRTYFAQLNFYDCLCCGTTNNNAWHVYLPDVDWNYYYPNYFGVLNNAYYQGKFYNYMSNYLDNLIDSTVEDAKSSSYQNGVRFGKDSRQAEVDSLIASRDYWRDLYESGNTNWAQFKNLLALIFTFPIRLFKEGFGVEIWGINIGYFILGIFLIALTLSIIALVRRGRLK